MLLKSKPRGVGVKNLNKSKENGVANTLAAVQQLDVAHLPLNVTNETKSNDSVEANFNVNRRSSDKSHHKQRLPASKQEPVKWRDSDKKQAQAKAQREESNDKVKLPSFAAVIKEGDRDVISAEGKPSIQLPRSSEQIIFQPEIDNI